MSIELSPSSVQLTPRGTAQVLVVVRNNSRAAVERLVLSSLSGTRLNAPVRHPSLAALPPEGTATWNIDIAATPPPSSDTQLVFRLDYKTARAPASRSGVATATLEVKAPPPRRPDELVKVEVQTSVESVEQRRPGDFYLVIGNLSRAPIQVLGVRPTTPSFVNVTPAPDVKFPVQIGAVDSAVLQYTVSTTDKVRPGKQLVLFAVTVQADNDGLRQNMTLIASRTFSAAVFGESALLGVVAVPSFLVLPGFLMLASFRIMAVDVWKRRELDIFKVASPEFWVVAVVLSLLTIPAYPFLTGLAAKAHLLPGRRNYLDGYGFSDIAIVWIGSIVVGVVVFFVVDLYMRTRRRRRTPSVGDSLVQLLYKLDRNGRSVRLPPYKAKNPEQNVFLLEREDFGTQAVDGQQAADRLVWVAPRAVAVIPADLTDDFTQLLDAGAPKPLADFLKRKRLTYRWQPPRKGPSYERYGDLTPLGRNELLIQSEPAEATGMASVRPS